MDERVARRGGTGGSSVCPRGLVYCMDELHVLLMPPRSSLSLLGGTTSSSMLRGDSQIECLCEELDDGAFDDDDRVFLPKKLVDFFHMVAAQTHNESTGGFLPWKNTQSKYMEV